MKRIILFITLVLFITTATFAQGVMALINHSEDFFNNLNNGKFEDAQNFFAESVKAKVSPEALKTMWTSMTTQFGEIASFEDEQASKQGEYQVVIITCKFARATQGFRFVYNTSQQLVGFFIQPAANTAAYAPPSYADTTLYKERPIQLTTPVAGHTLAGILTLPRKGTAFPIVILVHGSGPGDMDETVGPNKPFKDLAAGLAAKGIATIRYVKRTRVYPGDFNGTYTVKEEVMDDALSAIALAKTFPEINKKQIYLLGHSLGGMLAPRIATLSPDLNGIILAAAPARKLTDLMVEQNINLFSNSKDTTKAGHAALDQALKNLEITRITKLGTVKPDSNILGIPAVYWIDLNNYDQVATAKKLRARMLVIQGGNDVQVSMEDYKLWQTGLATRKNATFKTYPALDHLLSPQPEKDYTATYSKQVNVADYLVNDIAAWIKAVAP